MKLLRLSALVLLAGLAIPSTLAGAGKKPILVHYMPWYVAKPTSENWGWHWTMGYFKPDITDESGQRAVASWFNPLIGPYDSADPAVLEYHVLLMKLSGIDGVIVDWYGMDDFHDYSINNERTLAMLKFVRRAGLQFSLCYEDRTIQEEVSKGLISDSDAVTHAQQTLLYAQSNYFNDPSYLRLFNGQPVLLNFGPQYFKLDGQWASIFSVLDPTNQPSFFTLDHRQPGATGAFNWPPMHLSQAEGGTLSPEMREEYLDNFEHSGSHWPAFVSSAFPRFHDIYQQAGVGPSYGFLDDDNGATFRATLTRGMTNDSAMIQLVTWNDFGEGTVIEPTIEHGYRDLGVIQDLRRQYFDPGFPHGTNELRLAIRLYDLRSRQADMPGLAGELDQAFEEIVVGDLLMADLRLAGLEALHPQLHDSGETTGTHQPVVSDFSSPLEVQTVSEREYASQIVGPVTVGTNRTAFVTPISEQPVPPHMNARNPEP